MTLATKIIFIAALILSIIIPFGYYLIGEKNKKRYKRTIGVNAFFFFGAFALASIMMLGGPDVQAAETAATGSGLAEGLGYIAAALVTGLSCVGGGIAVASAASAALGVLSRSCVESSNKRRFYNVSCRKRICRLRCGCLACCRRRFRCRGSRSCCHGCSRDHGRSCLYECRSCDRRLNLYNLSFRLLQGKLYAVFLIFKLCKLRI